MQCNGTADSSKADCWSALRDPDFLMSAGRHPFPSFAASACTSFGRARHHLRASARQEIWDRIAANEAGMLLHFLLLNLLQLEAFESALAMPMLCHAQTCSKQATINRFLHNCLVEGAVTRRSCDTSHLCSVAASNDVHGCSAHSMCCTAACQVVMSISLAHF